MPDSRSPSRKAGVAASPVTPTEARARDLSRRFAKPMSILRQARLDMLHENARLDVVEAIRAAVVGVEDRSETSFRLERGEERRHPLQQRGIARIYGPCEPLAARQIESDANLRVKGAADPDGPQQFHVILVDGGRTGLIGGEMQAMLRCIRCGACMNHCPVYQSVGGHAYGWVYPGPMGSVLTPSYVGLENALDLPNAATFCNQCGVVCPVKIPLPDLMRKLRERQFAQRLKPWRERVGLQLWVWLAQRPAFYGIAAAIGARVLAWMGGADKLVHKLPLGRGWTAGRDFPAPQGKTFRDLYTQRSSKATQEKH